MISIEQIDYAKGKFNEGFHIFVSLRGEWRLTPGLDATAQAVKALVRSLSF